MTPPYLYAPPELAQPGSHTFKYDIANVAAGGLWRMSAVMIALGN